MGTIEERRTFCRLCEAQCGLIVHTDGTSVTKITGDPEHPLSRGYLCPKGSALVELQTDPKRVRNPLKRQGERGSGQWKTVGWDEAMGDIASRLGAIPV